MSLTCMDMEVPTMPDRFSLFSRPFWRAAAQRAVRTVAQTAVATIGTAVVLTDVDWTLVGSASVLAGVLSVLTAVATDLPEVEG